MHLLLSQGVGFEGFWCKYYVNMVRQVCAEYEACAAAAQADGIDCPPVDYPECKEKK